MICPECNGRGETTYYVETDRDENTVTVVARKDICHTCNGSGKMPMTNADRIRAMSDEELAELINAFGHDFPPYCKEEFVTECDYNCIKCAVEWLKQPAETPTENADRCVCCGAIIPEGQIVCPNCLVTVKEG